MNKPIAILTGRLWAQAKLVTPETGGKPFVDLTVKMTPRTWNGKTYFQKVYVRSYNQATIAMIPQLAAETMVTVTGDADAVAEQGRDGKTYANIRVTGSVVLFDGAVPETQTGTTPAPAVAPQPKAVAPVNAAAPTEDDVPF